MRLPVVLSMLVAIQLSAQAPRDQSAIRTIIQNEISAWNKGDAAGYSRDFATAGTFTNIRGQFLRAIRPSSSSTK